MLTALAGGCLASAANFCVGVCVDGCKPLAKGLAGGAFLDVVYVVVLLLLMATVVLSDAVFHCMLDDDMELVRAHREA